MPILPILRVAAIAPIARRAHRGAGRATRAVTFGSTFDQARVMTMTICTHSRFITTRRSI